MLDQRPASHASEHLALPYIPFEFPRVFDTFAAWLFLAPRPREMLSNTPVRYVRYFGPPDVKPWFLSIRSLIGYVISLSTTLKTFRKHNRISF